MEKILVIRSGAIGDIIMATPFIRNLRESFPEAEISFLLGEWSRSVLDNNPNLDKIITFKDEIVIKKKLFKIISLISQLRKERYNLCFILDKSWMWNLFAFLCRIKQRFGFSRGREGIWNTKSIPFEGRKNEVDYNQDLLTLINIRPKEYLPEIFTAEKDKQYANNFTRNIKEPIGICPGGTKNPGQTAAIKRWPLENYIDLTNRLGRNFIIFGDKDDKGLALRIKKESKNKNIHDTTGNTIQQAKELMERCSIIITHDSGSLHIASATKAKIIALFGPTPKERFCPKKAVCITSHSPPCYTIYGRFRKCNGQMKEITVEEVLGRIPKS